jgi:hypothetical protein
MIPPLARSRKDRISRAKDSRGAVGNQFAILAAFLVLDCDSRPAISSFCEGWHRFRALWAGFVRAAKKEFKEVIMKKIKSLKLLSMTFFLSGIWDILAGLVYLFMIGTVFTEPPVHRFYALFIASFLFCFAYLQILSAFNIRRYLLNIGCVTIGRIFYVVLLFAYIFGIPGFPRTFLWTGIVDLFWSILYIGLTLISDEIRIKDLFLPHKEGDGLAKSSIFHQSREKMYNRNRPC